MSRRYFFGMGLAAAATLAVPIARPSSIGWDHIEIPVDILWRLEEPANWLSRYFTHTGYEVWQAADGRMLFDAYSDTGLLKQAAGMYVRKRC